MNTTSDKKSWTKSQINWLFRDKLHNENVWYFFCLVSAEAPAVVPYRRCCMDGDEMGREQVHGGAVGYAGQGSCRCKEDKEWRFSMPTMPSAQAERAHKWHSLLTRCWRHLTCIGDTFSLNGQGPLRRSCLQLRNMDTSIYGGYCGRLSGSGLPVYG